MSKFPAGFVVGPPQKSGVYLTSLSCGGQWTTPLASCWTVVDGRSWHRYNQYDPQDVRHASCPREDDYTSGVIEPDNESIAHMPLADARDPMRLDTFLDLIVADQQANPHAVHVVDDLERVCARIANDATYPRRIRDTMRDAATRLRDAVREMPDE